MFWDLEYFWIKFSILINARLSDLSGTFVQGTNICGTSQRDAMDQEKNPTFILVFYHFSSINWCVNHLNNTKRVHSNNFQHKSQHFHLLNSILSVKKIKICLFHILYDEKNINCTFKLNHVPPKLVCFKTDNFSGEN